MLGRNRHGEGKKPAKNRGQENPGNGKILKSGEIRDSLNKNRKPAGTASIKTENLGHDSALRSRIEDS